MNEDYYVISQELEEVVYEYKFKKKVKYTVWKNFFQKIYTQDNVGAATIIIKNQFIKEKNVLNIFGDNFDNFENITYFVGDILATYLKFPEVVVYKQDSSAKAKEIASKFIFPSKSF